MNIADVKKELSGDEKVLESAFKLETIYKKHKVVIWAVIMALVLFFVGKTIMQSMQEAKLAEANSAFLVLQEDAEDAEALAALKENNPSLFELFTYAQANKKKDTKTLALLATSSDTILADASAYAAATLENKPKASVLYKEMAILEEAYILLKSKDMKGAKEKLTLIDERSPLYKIASFLLHSTLKAK